MIFLEFQIVFYEVFNLVNERLIGCYLILFEDGVYFCLNDILLGCFLIKVFNGLFNESVDFRKCFYFIKNVVDVFWSRWI